MASCEFDASSASFRTFQSSFLEGLVVCFGRWHVVLSIPAQSGSQPFCLQKYAGGAILKFFGRKRKKPHHRFSASLTQPVFPFSSSLCRRKVYSCSFLPHELGRLQQKHCKHRSSNRIHLSFVSNSHIQHNGPIQSTVPAQFAGDTIATELL